MAARTDKEKRSREVDRSSIAAFYAGRSIFITGATGFLGKVLVEKLLRACPGVREIFLLMRPKKGLSIDERLKQMLQLPLFDKLREQSPSSFDKLIPVQGDVMVEGLGLPEIERRVITERASVIFHVAANVRFNENLKKDIFSNTRSTRDICILAGSMKNLVALVHVSSAFAQADKPVVEEIVYPPITSWKDAIRMVETLDEHVLQTFTAKYRGTMPNTYTLSKRLAEQVIADHSKDLPCVIFRPSIVVSTIEDPVSGWLDNFNGPVGMMIAGGKGILRVAYSNPRVSSDFLPIDVAINAMLTSAWKRGLRTVTEDPSVHVYNCTSHRIRRIVNKELVELALRLNEEIPLEGSIWYPRTLMTRNRFLYYILTLLIHLLPAFIIDGMIKLSGGKPMLVRLQRKIYTGVLQLSHFLHNEWAFVNGNMLNILMKELPSAERKIFGFDYSDFQPEPFLRNCLIGAKRYLLHEDMNRLEEAKRHYNRMRWIDRIFNVCLIALIAWIFIKIGVLSHVAESFRSLLDGSFLDD